MPLCSNFYFIVCSLAQLLKCLQPLPWVISSYHPPLTNFSPTLIQWVLRATAPRHQHSIQAMPCAQAAPWSQQDISPGPPAYMRVYFLHLYLLLLLSWCQELCLQLQRLIFHINNNLISFLAAFISKISKGFLSWNPLVLSHVLYSFPHECSCLLYLFEFLKASQNLIRVF